MVLMGLLGDVVPPGVINVVTGPGGEIGKALATNPRIAKIAFTGETTTGRMLDVMAVLTTIDGSVLFTNPPFRAFFPSFGNKLSDLEIFQDFFNSSSERPERVRVFTIRERTLLWVVIPFPVIPGQNALLFLLVDVDNKLLQGEEFREMNERMK